eukprot:s965_g25.t2
MSVAHRASSASDSGVQAFSGFDSSWRLLSWPTCNWWPKADCAGMTGNLKVDMKALTAVRMFLLLAGSH